MDRRERQGDAQEAHRVAMEGALAETWTALPGIVQSFDATKRTCTVQPSLNMRAQSEDGTYSWISLPVLVDCPVFFPSGGGVTLTFPIKAGDECLVVFSSRCIDSWWQSGGVQNQAEVRMHDLSDGFVYVGVSSVPKVISNISTTRAQFRSDDGAAFVEIDPSSHLIRAHTSGDIVAEAGGNINATAGGFAHVTATAEITLNAPVVNINAPIINMNGSIAQTTGGGSGASTFQGTMTVQGTLKSNTEVVAVTTPLHTHVHTGVTAGGANTGGPTP